MDEGNKYALYKIMQRRVKEVHGIRPIVATTGSGKSTAIAYVLKNKDYDKSTFIISNNRANTQSIYYDHEKIIGDSFKNEALILYSKSDFLKEDLFKNEESRDKFEEFLTDIYPNAKFLTKEDNKTLSEEILTRMVILDSYNIMDKVISKFMPDKKRLISSEELKENMKSQNNIFNFNNSQPTVEEQCLDEIKRLIKKSITSFIKDEQKRLADLTGTKPNKSSIKEMVIKKIITNEYGEFDWLLNIVPEIHLLGFDKPYGRIKTAYMNIHKFNAPLNTTISGYTSIPTYACDFVKNSVIFIDESDDCYDKIMDICAEESANISTYDYLKGNIKLINSILYDKEILDKRIRKKGELETLKKEVLEPIVNKYEGKLKTEFKIYDDSDKAHDILFYGNYTKKGVISYNYNFYYDADDGRYNIIKGNSTLEQKLEKEGYKIYNMQDLFEDIYLFNKEFEKLLLKQIKRLNASENARKNFDNVNNFSLHDEGLGYIESVVNIYVDEDSNVQKYFVQRMIDKMHRYAKKEAGSKNLQLRSPLYNGFNIMTYRDNDINNKLKTTVLRNYLNKTPEKFLYDIASVANVIPMSATQDITTRYKNFMYDEVASWIGYDHYYNPSDNEFNSLRKETIRKTNNYKNIDLRRCIIKSNKEVIKNNEADIYFKSLEKDFNTELSIYVERLSLLKKRNEEVSYYFELLKNIVYAFKIYIERNAQHGVFLTSFDIKDEGDGKIKQRYLKQIFEIITKREGIDNIKLYFTRASGYKDVFKEANKAYRENYRTIILTSYNNLSTGQNLSFKLDANEDGSLKDTERNNTTEFVKPNTHNIGDFTKVDADLIYLGDITGIGVRLSDIFDKNTGAINKTNRTKYIYQLERAYASGAIDTIFKKNMKIRSIGMSQKELEEDRILANKYDNDIEKEEEILRIIIQSIGRISRNCLNHKSKTIVAIDKIINEKLFYERKADSINLEEIKVLYDMNSYKQKQFNNLLDDASCILAEGSKKARALDIYLEDIVKDIRENLEASDIYDSFRSYKLFFPFFKDLEDIPEDLRCYFIKVPNPCRNIYASPLGDKKYIHSTKKTRKANVTIGMDAPFIKDLLTNETVRETLRLADIDIPREFDKFNYFPCSTYFNNITKGYWCELIGGLYLINKEIEIKELEQPIKEAFDAKIEVEDKNRVIFIDYKNWSYFSGKIDATKDEKDQKNHTSYIVDHAKTKVELIKETIEDYKSKDIRVVYINLYDPREGARQIGIEQISDCIYDARSIFYKDSNGLTQINPIEKEIEKLL